MKNLIDYINDYINESVLSDIEDTLSVSDDDLAVELITNWIKDNWNIVDNGELTIKFEGNIRVVDCSGSVKWPKTGKITNDMFVWGNVMGDFVFNALDTDTNKVKTFIGLGLPRFVGGTLNLHSFTNVTNLEGLPDNVGSLHISGFKKLTSLKGCPINVDNRFTITSCASLKGLDYLPEHIGGGITINHNVNLLSIDGLSAVTNVVNGDLFLNGNYKLKSLEGCPAIIDGMFSCEKCKALTSLSGFPERVGSHIYCKHCATRFTVDQIQAICAYPPGYKIDAYKR
jgi:hypothetical protein